MTDEPPGPWRYFQSREVKEARAWAASGGIAVHENIFKSRGRRTCHLLAVDETRLVRAAVSVGCSPYWIQRTNTLHFDLVEPQLTRALDLCPNYPPATGR
ncbi:MAG: DUF4031 domain-containing protein [Gemmatimonadetes bacterium]|nr:DUF4031 domain-containing protein [Gemmatimonadota bacterium]